MALCFDKAERARVSVRAISQHSDATTRPAHLNERKSAFRLDPYLKHDSSPNDEGQPCPEVKGALPVPRLNHLRRTYRSVIVQLIQLRTHTWSAVIETFGVVLLLQAQQCLVIVAPKGMLPIRLGWISLRDEDRGKWKCVKGR